MKLAVAVLLPDRTVTLTVVVPAAVGVPEITPVVLFSTRPAGRAVLDQV